MSISIVSGRQNPQETLPYSRHLFGANRSQSRSSSHPSSDHWYWWNSSTLVFFFFFLNMFRFFLLPWKSIAHQIDLKKQTFLRRSNDYRHLWTRRISKAKSINRIVLSHLNRSIEYDSDREENLFKELFQLESSLKRKKEILHQIFSLIIEDDSSHCLLIGLCCASLSFSSSSSPSLRRRSRIAWSLAVRLLHLSQSLRIINYSLSLPKNDQLATANAHTRC